jgi:hypothetical protein
MPPWTWRTGAMLALTRLPPMIEKRTLLSFIFSSCFRIAIKGFDSA